MRKIYLVFTRDNNQWVNEMVDYVFSEELPKIFGKGLTTQITRFTGRTFEWYRFANEMEDLKNAVIKKKLTDWIFDKKAHAKFLIEVAKLRKLISVKPNKIKNAPKLLQQIKRMYIKVYPLYVLALFVPGPWREDFIKIHKENSQPILNLLFKSREGSEGLLKEITNFMRVWLGPELQSMAYPNDYLKLLSVKEVEDFVNCRTLPLLSELKERSNGFVHMNKKMFKIKSFDNFLKSKKISVIKENIKLVKNTFSGSVGFSGPMIRGRVKVVLNSNEMVDFKEGMILVTPMTAPEYLPIMKKAAAIITNEGGITCHAAIVARELRKPCIIGTKIATSTLKDNDLVEVDANNGVVRKIKD
jgi:phosphohistidine swiveling domain-containing protein